MSRRDRRVRSVHGLSIEIPLGRGARGPHNSRASFT